jgi:small subunit ribosomal protein S16
MGRSNRAFFRLSAIDSRAPRDGRVIEELGHYDPCERDKAKQFIANLERCKYWMDQGAQPSETVSSLLKKQGVEHKQLRLRGPGRPKAVAGAPAAKAGASTADAATAGAAKPDAAATDTNQTQENKEAAPAS